MVYEKKPWLEYYDPWVPETIDYPEITMYEGVAQSCREHANDTALEFLGFEMNYGTLLERIDKFARILYDLGLREGDRITIAMPTCPQGIIAFYAANKLGAVASMIHPLSPPNEVEFYLNLSKSKMALTIDMFYENFEDILDKTNVEKVILAKIQDYLGFIKTALFWLVKGRKIKVPEDPKIHWWSDLFEREYSEIPESSMGFKDLAVILYSGGTTGLPKGIKLSNKNFICEGLQVTKWGDLNKDDSMLVILPIFHGFGLGVCINAGLMAGGMGILVPTFTPEKVVKLIGKKQPTFMVGVPTLFEAMNKDPKFQNDTDLSSLRGAFSGADTLPRIVKENFEEIAKKSGNEELILREGYGLTETVTACAAMPMNEYREGSIGIPFPDMLMKVVKMDENGESTTQEAPIGEEGEICVSGPDVMMGYLDNPEETKNVLKEHDDGRIWVHTGDVATMDEDGFFYFQLRKKRMIKSSGFNVYPVQVEAILNDHPDVANSCVIGVPDKDQVERVKAYVVLEDQEKATKEMEKALISHCRENLLKWKCPRDLAFTEELPKTLVGKVAYKVLEDKEKERLRAEGKYAGD